MKRGIQRKRSVTSRSPLAVRYTLGQYRTRVASAKGQWGAIPHISTGHSVAGSRKIGCQTDAPSEYRA
eukprot:1510526-Rhodomonas_salina.2